MSTIAFQLGRAAAASQSAFTKQANPSFMGGAQPLQHGQERRGKAPLWQAPAPGAWKPGSMNRMGNAAAAGLSHGLAGGPRAGLTAAYGALNAPPSAPAPGQGQGPLHNMARQAMRGQVQDAQPQADHMQRSGAYQDLAEQQKWMKNWANSSGALSRLSRRSPVGGPTDPLPFDQEKAYQQALKINQSRKSLGQFSGNTTDVAQMPHTQPSKPIDRLSGLVRGRLGGLLGQAPASPASPASSSSPARTFMQR